MRVLILNLNADKNFYILFLIIKSILITILYKYKRQESINLKYRINKLDIYLRDARNVKIMIFI